MALKVGQNRFYEYIRAFGFGSRSGVELPGETAGCSSRSSVGRILDRLDRHGQKSPSPHQLVTMFHHRQWRRLLAAAHPLSQ